MNKGLRALILIAAVGALAVVPAISSAGGKLGQLIGSDHDKGKSAVAVAQGIVQNPGKMTMVVTSHPRHHVAWNYTTDCFRAVPPGYSQWPPPGQSEDTISTAPIRKRLKTGGLRNPDYCQVFVSAKLDYNSAKSVTAKIYNK
jgi:hypothetical protein